MLFIMECVKEREIVLTKKEDYSEQPTVEKFSEMLDVKSLENDIYLGRHLDFSSRHVYGGQMVSQAMLAAQSRLDAESVRLNQQAKQLQSMHCYFLEPGDKRLPVYYRVAINRNGRTFSSANIQGFQRKKQIPLEEERMHQADSATEQLIFEAMALFQKPEQGVHAHQSSMPLGLPHPDDVESERVLRKRWLAEAGEQLAALWGLQSLPESLINSFLKERPVDVRPIDPVNPILPVVETWQGQTPPPELLDRRFWFQFRDHDIAYDRAQKGDHSEIMIKSALAYMSDYGMLGPTMRPHGLSFLDRNVKSASLDHSIWFHRKCCLKGWFLYQIESTNLSDSRGLSHGKIYTQSGELVASTAQEGLIRLRKKKTQ